MDQVDVPSPDSLTPTLDKSYFTSVLNSVVPSSGQHDEQQTCSCKGATSENNKDFTPIGFVYAMGQIKPRFPNLSVEREFVQAGRNLDTCDKSDREVFHLTLTQPQNRYLLKQLCWVFTVQGVDTYLLRPRDPVDFDMLKESVQQNSNEDNIDLIIGLRGPIASPEMCNGLLVPIVAFDQIYSFNREYLINSVHASLHHARDKQFDNAIREVFDRICQMTDNAGATDADRAMNYLAVRYPEIYVKAADCYCQDCMLADLQIKPSRLSGARKIIDVIFSFTHRKTDVDEKYFVRVDVTDEFPFLVTKMSPYYDR